MAIQQINLGTYSNDGTGDDLRTAFEKVKANFIELYSISGGANVGENPPISGVEQGELWWSTVEGILYIYYNGAWVEATAVPPQIFYDISATATTGGANIHLNGSNDDSDDVKIASSTNITVTRTDANTITLSSTSYTGNVTGNLTGDVTGNLTGNVTGDVTGNLTGNVTGSVTGNAGSVTNGVYTNGSYANPTWITSLAGSKVSGSITGNAGSVTNGVYTTSSVNALADVDTVTATPTIGQALVWNGTNWIPGSVASGGGSGTLDFGSFTAPADIALDLGTF
jgi:hypothetical protein